MTNPGGYIGEAIAAAKERARECAKRRKYRRNAMAKKRTKKLPPHPQQPCVYDKNGKVRFRENKIVSVLLDAATKAGVMSLNTIAEMDFSEDERAHFAQLIGYSIAGYSELGYVTDDAYALAEKARDELR